MNTPSLVFAAVLGIAQVPFANVSFQRDILVANDKGYVLGLDRCIAGPGTLRQWEWSKDGQAIALMMEGRTDAERLRLLKGESLPPNVSLTVYDLAKSTTTVLTADRGNSIPVIHGWLPGARCLLYSVVKALPSGPNRDQPEIQWTLYRWMPGGSAQTVLTAPQTLDVAISPKRPYALIRGYEMAFRVPQAAAPNAVTRSDPKQSAFVVGLSGMASTLQMPPNLSPDFALDREGAFIYVSYTFSAAGPGAQRKATETFYRVGADGRSELLSAEPSGLEPLERSRLRPTRDPNGLQLMQTVTEAKHASDQAKLQTYWMWIPEKGKVKATLVAPEAIRAELAPTNTAVAYATESNVFVRSIDTVDRAGLEAMMEAAERRVLMSNAKQVGTAMAIYCADADDLLPPNADWQNTVMPYLKNKSMMDGFVYELNGEDTSKLTDPAKKRLGYIEGRYGRAIVYADTHVIWEKRRQP